eukprot:TRINITY_DN4452_c0_g1_i15.p1 TRINITY_DN4452_c0_g1~~TRINITY_DN4452_c0_g1_i15.p1  ORF type:complete len:120 (-),score=27.41 TRINITY_DN4452_c0_g1_i15:164-523(-)
MSDTKASREVTTLDEFYHVLQHNPDKATYGFKHVTRCNDQLAIEKLLISDSLFRSQNIKTRATYVDLVQKARENGADVLIFSSLHVSGSQLDQLSGIAAILRFPIQEQETSGDDEEYSI